jgi:mannose-6-phosphate isomerase-like protein (cupin superfamily)
VTERAALAALEGTPHAEVFAADPRTIRLTLAADEAIPPRHPDRDVLIHVLSGRLSVSVGDETHELGAGELLRFDGDRDVAPTALEASTALVVLAPS